MSYNFYPSGTRIADRYEVAGRPLVGGMGIVYLCFDHQEQRPVALKTFKPEFLPDRAARERFLREGATWLALGRHSHVVHAYGVERIGGGGDVHLVLELVAKMQGRQDASLRSYLIPGRPLPTAEAVGFALQVARGMVHATATVNAFVHRDLKPENVLVGADRLAGSNLNRVRVTDFGLVRAVVAAEVGEASETLPSSGTKRRLGLTQIGSVLGTPAYMAPEQWAGANVTLQADIYALGCILGEMLVGQRLVQATTLDGYRRAHQDGQTLQRVQGLPIEVQSVLMRCLALAPSDRYATWTEVGVALAALYWRETRLDLSESSSHSVLNHGEQVAVGWSNSAIGGSYLDLGQAEKALWFFTQAQQVGQSERDRALESGGLASMGLAYLNLGEVGQAIEYLEQSFEIDQERGDRWGMGVTLGNLGASYTALGDIRSAIGYLEQALLINQGIGNREGETHNLGNLGIAYTNLGDANRAIAYHEQALVISRDIGDRQGECMDLGNLGEAHRHLGDMQQAIIYYEQSLTLSREIGNRRGEGNALGNLGIAYKNLDDAHRAIGYYEQALTIRREIGDLLGEGIDLGNLGGAYLQMDDTDRAIAYYKQALAIHRTIGNINGVASIAFNIALVYVELDDPASALPLAQEAAHLFSQMGHTAYAERAQGLVEELERQGG